MKFWRSYIDYFGIWLFSCIVCYIASLSPNIELHLFRIALILTLSLISTYTHVRCEIGHFLRLLLQPSLVLCRFSVFSNRGDVSFLCRLFPTDRAEQKTSARPMLNRAGTISLKSKRVRIQTRLYLRHVVFYFDLVFRLPYLTGDIADREILSRRHNASSIRMVPLPNRWYMSQKVGFLLPGLYLEHPRYADTWSP